MRRDANDGKANRWRDGPRKEGQGNHHIRGNRTASQGHWTGREEPQDSDILLLISPCLLEAGAIKGQLDGHIPGKAQGSGRARRSSPGAMAGSQSCPQHCHRNGPPLPRHSGGRVRTEGWGQFMGIWEGLSWFRALPPTL